MRGEVCYYNNHRNCDGLGNCEAEKFCYMTYRHATCTYDRYQKQKEEDEKNDKKDDDSTQMD